MCLFAVLHCASWSMGILGMCWPSRMPGMLAWDWAHACSPANGFCHLPAVGRGVRTCSQASPLPQGHLESLLGDPSVPGLRVGRCWSWPQPLDGDAERGGCSWPGMQRGHGAGRTHPGGVGRRWDQASSVVPSLSLTKTESKIKGRIPRWQPQALNSRHGVFWAGAMRRKYHTNLRLVSYWETLQPETWLHSQLCPFSPTWPCSKSLEALWASVSSSVKGVW